MRTSELGERQDGKWKEFPLMRRPREFYERLAAGHGLAVSDVGTLNTLGHHTGSSLQDSQMMLRFARASAMG